MVWPGIAFLFILLTIMSHMIDGHRGFGSTILRQHISAAAIEIPVKNRDGFADEGLLYIDNETIRYSRIGSDSTGDPVFIAPGGRGANQTSASAHYTGASVYSETTEALNEAISFQVAETDTIWGAVQYPFQAVGFFGKFVSKTITWDYQYLEGPGIWVKMVLLYPLSVLVIFSLINVFKDALSILGIRR